MSVGTGANEKDALVHEKTLRIILELVLILQILSMNLDVEGQIRTTRSIISDTAQVVNLDIQTIINPALGSSCSKFNKL